MYILSRRSRLRQWQVNAAWYIRSGGQAGLNCGSIYGERVRVQMSVDQLPLTQYNKHDAAQVLDPVVHVLDERTTDRRHNISYNRDCATERLQMTMITIICIIVLIVLLNIDNLTNDE